MPSVDTAASSETIVHSAIVIGAGFGGIGMAVALLKEGVDDILVLEKDHDLGGVWRDNTYPGAACDVPSHLYSFSFAPNPTWSRLFSGQAEIHAYLVRCARDFGVAPKIAFGIEVIAAEWDDRRAVWKVTSADGLVIETRILISAIGLLGRPVPPNVQGLDRPHIPAFHSARWRHDLDFAGKNVAVIGTGASAVQFVPALAVQALMLTIFQRSPPWIMPRPDRVYTEADRARFTRHPWLMRLHRLRLYMLYEMRAVALTRFNGIMTSAVGRPFTTMLEAQVPDASLRTKLVPNYPIGCKRILVSSNYLSALSRPNVEVVTEAISTLTENGIQTDDDRHRTFDAIVYASGFDTTAHLAPIRITGRAGRDLNTAWRTGAMAYFGISVPNFPNFFILYGPNTNLGHSSIIYMLESQIAHVMRCWRRKRASGAVTIEIKDEAHVAQAARVQRRLTRSVWTGCRSWYVDAKGHNSINWPGFTFTYRWLTRYGSLSTYRFAALPSVSEATQRHRDGE